MLCVFLFPVVVLYIQGLGTKEWREVSEMQVCIYTVFVVLFSNTNELLDLKDLAPQLNLSDQKIGFAERAVVHWQKN